MYDFTSRLSDAMFIVKSIERSTKLRYQYSVFVMPLNRSGQLLVIILTSTLLPPVIGISQLLRPLIDIVNSHVTSLYWFSLVRYVDTLYRLSEMCSNSVIAE